MRKSVVILLVVLLPVIGLGAGRLVSPLLARTHYTVRLADQVRRETEHPDVEPTLESNAFRTLGRKSEDLFAEAAGLEATFRTGGALLGAWSGLVVALVVFGLNRERRREIWEIDLDSCVACGRCFRSCPRERLTLEEIGKPTPKSV